MTLALVRPDRDPLEELLARAADALGIEPGTADARRLSRAMAAAYAAAAGDLEPLVDVLEGVARRRTPPALLAERFGYAR